MSQPQAKKVKELLGKGWKVVIEAMPRPGAPVTVVDPDGKRWLVGADGSLTEAT